MKICDHECVLVSDTANETVISVNGRNVTMERGIQHSGYRDPNTGALSPDGIESVCMDAIDLYYVDMEEEEDC